MQKLLRILLAVFFSFNASACIWDAQSLSREKSRSHDLAQTILSEPQNSENTNQLRATIKELETNRKEGDVSWWNNLAGAYLRLNQPQDAVRLLEPVVEKFPDDYGIHANLGTAYHLLGRYQDAEKEIARDLEINPKAHFGLEKYHLALLQYLVRDAKYQARHVYVDEFTVVFLTATGPSFDLYNGEMEEGALTSKAHEYATVETAEAAYQSISNASGNPREILRMLAIVAVSDPPPAYRKDADLHHDTNMEAGVIYMAQMNPKEPACSVMLGIAAWKQRNYHLAISAFDRAIALGSPQSELLKEKIGGLREFIRHSQENQWTMRIIGGTVIGLPVALIAFFILRPLLRLRLRPRVDQL
jgi:tetratricopeptide (TPR) repeat protein